MPSPPTSNYNVLIDSLGIPVGSGADVLTTYHIAHLASLVFSGSVNWDMVLEHLPHLGYLYEMWLSSAAREQGTTVDDLVFFTNQASVGISRPNLKQLYVSFIAPPKGGFSAGTVNPSYDFGYCQFLYDNGAAELVHITHQKMKLVPTRRACVGANLWFRETLSGNYIVYCSDSGDPKLLGGSGKPVAPSTNEFDGLGWGVEASVENTQFTDAQPFVIPAVSGGVFTTNEQTGQAAFDPTTALASGPWVSATYPYMVETWQDLVQPETGTNSHTYSVHSSDDNYEASLAYLKSAKLVCAPPAGTRPDLKWRCGLPIYGYWAPLYGEFCGVLEPINLITSAIVPHYRRCTGVWIYLKKGVTASLITQEAANQVQGCSNPSGNLIFAQGQTDGLTWDV